MYSLTMTDEKVDNYFFYSCFQNRTVTDYILA